MRVRVKLWVLLLVLCFLLPLALTFAPAGFPDMLKVFQPLLCENDETLITTQNAYADFRGRGTSFNYYCRDLEDQTKDVTGQYVRLILGIGLIPFVLVIILGAIMARRFTKSFFDLAQPAGFYSGTSPNVIMQTQTYDLNDPQLKQKIAQMKTNFGTGNVNTTDLMETLSAVSSAFAKGDFQTSDMTSDSLTEKLRELKDALDSSLIIQSEYDRKRQDILDSFK